MNIKTAKIIEDPKVINAKYGECILIKCKVLDTGEPLTVFGKLDDPIASSKTKGDVINLVKNGNGNYKIVAGLKPVKEIIPSATENLLEDIPQYSDLDKKKLADYIRQQSKLLRFTVDVITEDFPELVGVDERGIRSMALSLMIGANQIVLRNM